jgi:hypothetical protein
MGMVVLLAILIGLGLVSAALMAHASGQGFRGRRALLFALLVPMIVFLIWIAVMSLGVGPAMRGI